MDRVVVDLRLINRFVQPRLFNYQCLASLLSSLVPGDHLVSWDVMDALYHIRIHPAPRKYFRFLVDGVVYEPRVLPFGMRLSPWAGEGKGKGALPLLGFLVDTRRHLLLFPAERMAKLVTRAKILLSAVCRNGRRVPNRVLQRFTGTPVSCSLPIPSARFFLRRLYHAHGGLERERASARLPALWGVGASRKRTGVALLTHGAMENLRGCAGMRTEPGVGQKLWQPDAGILTTDASPHGLGGHLGRLLPVAGFFTLLDQQQHINIKEVAAVRFCLTTFGSDLLRRGG
eukprot:contig_2859_g579